MTMQLMCIEIGVEFCTPKGKFHSSVTKPFLQNREISIGFCNFGCRRFCNDHVELSVCCDQRFLLIFVPGNRNLGIMSNKPRPLDGPGANGLRGGRNVYNSGKTAIGVWLDAKGGPSGYKRGYHTSDYQTEAQSQQDGARFYTAPYFGAELPNPEHLHRKAPKMQDLFDPLYSKEAPQDYLTNTGAMYKQQGAKVEESHLPRSNMPRAQLEAYQQTWSSDTPASRAMRFQTENRRAGNAANKNFQTPSVRLMPGTPIMIEKYRQLLIDKFGVLALPVLRFHFGKGEMSCTEWKKRMAATEVKPFPHEVNQILAFYAPGNTIHVDRFVSMVAAKTDNFDDVRVQGIWNSLFGAGYRTTAVDVLARMNSAAFPEIHAGFEAFIFGYEGDDGLIGEGEFQTVHKDMYSTSPKADYEALVESLWG